MTRKIVPLILATLFASSCMTSAQRRNKADAVAAVAAAGAAVAAARLAGGETYSPTQMRLIGSDFRIAQEKLKAGDWEEAGRYARLAASVAEDIRSDSESARKRAPATKFSPVKKKPKIAAPK